MTPYERTLHIINLENRIRQLEGDLADMSEQVYNLARVVDKKDEEISVLVNERDESFLECAKLGAEVQELKDDLRNAI